MTPEREEILRTDPGYAAWERSVRRLKDGWSVVTGYPGSKSCGRPHRTLAGAAMEWLFAIIRGPARIARHDAEMRRWGYLMAIIEPTPEEREQLPRWHRNYTLNVEDE